MYCRGSCAALDECRHVVPDRSGPRPGCGAIVALLDRLRIPGLSRGKPNPWIMRAARKRIGLSTDEVIMIGDTMETDIRGAPTGVHAASCAYRVDGG